MAKLRLHAYLAVKRTLDLVVAGAGLLVLSPLMLAIAAWIRAGSPGPVFYRGIRTGLGGRPFAMLKFRTMVVDAEARGGPSTGKDDPRITPAGRFLRRFKLDELPQLINVVKGDMSLVGPRPEVERYTRLYEGEEKLILTVIPGITDLSSLHFIRLDEVLGAENPDEVYETRVKPVKNALRVRYAKERSLALDLKILLLTIAKIGGYRGTAETPRI